MRAICRPSVFFLVAAAFLVAVAAEGARPGSEAPEAAASLAGRFLVAAQGMSDPRFRGAVIFMVRDDETGALGLVVNRRLTRSPIADMLGELGMDTEGVSGEIDVNYGGPVEPSAGFVLHSADYRGPNTVVVTPRVSLTTDPEVLRSIGLGEGPARAFFALGYAGWGPEQLADELARGDWVVAPADDDLIFDRDQAGKWQRALDNRGIDL